MRGNFKRMVFALVLLVWLLTGCKPDSTPTASQPQSARLSELSGSVEVRNPGQEAYLPAEEGMLLQEGGEVRTGSDGRARLDLSSGTIVRVAPDSSFILTTNHPAEDGLFTRLRLLAGQVWVVLTGGSLEIETPGGTAAVRGSHLMVWFDPVTMNVWVSCFEGQCAVSNPSGSLDLSTGEGAILYAVGEGETPPPPEAYLLTWEQFQAWAENVPEANALLPEILATLTAFVTPTATATSTPIATAGCALQLLSPANGAALPDFGTVVFSWSPQAGAVEYQLQIISLSGAINSFETEGTSLRLYIESLAAAGTYSWNVSALDANGHVICSAGSFTFTKPASFTEIPSPLPSVPSVPAFNTSFTFVEGPTGYPPELCNQRYFKVIVADPDGVSNVSVGYQVQDSLGTPVCAGALPLSFNNGMWSNALAISASPGDTVYWWFVAIDGLGNAAASEVYSYIEISYCP